MPSKMSLDQFVKDNQDSLNKFLSYWQEHHEKNPQHFPLKLLKGDWDEQFHLFCDENRICQ